MSAQHTPLAVEATDFDELYAFLSEHYLHSRFAGRDVPVWGNDYSRVVTQSKLERLSLLGVAFISPYESATGRPIKFDARLTILNPGAPKAQIGKKAGNLTHIYGSSL